MIGALNEVFRQAPDFAEVPDINGANEILIYTASAELPYKICPETDAEELVYVADQEKSMIEVISKHGKALWKKHVEGFKSWYKPSWLTKGKWSWDDNAQTSGGGTFKAVPVEVDMLKDGEEAQREATARLALLQCPWELELVGQHEVAAEDHVGSSCSLVLDSHPSPSSFLPEPS